MRLRTRHAVATAILLLGIGTIALWVSASSRAEEVLRVARDYERHGLSQSRVPPDWLAALVAVEDPGFYSHGGIDLTTPGAGWTTLTQALVKLHFPGPHRGLVGKPLQSFRAMALDRVVPKHLQLTLFLNTAYLGRGAGGAPITGFPAAALHHYGKPLSELSQREFLGLVAMLVGPDRFDPRRDSAAHAQRLRRIESLLAGRCHPRGWRDVFLDGCSSP